MIFNTVVGGGNRGEPVLINVDTVGSQIDEDYGYSVVNGEYKKTDLTASTSAYGFYSDVNSFIGVSLKSAPFSDATVNTCNVSGEIEIISGPSTSWGYLGQITFFFVKGPGTITFIQDT